MKLNPSKVFKRVLGALTFSSFFTLAGCKHETRPAPFLPSSPNFAIGGVACTFTPVSSTFCSGTFTIAVTNNGSNPLTCLGAAGIVGSSGYGSIFAGATTTPVSISPQMSGTVSGLYSGACKSSYGSALFAAVAVSCAISGTSSLVMKTEAPSTDIFCTTVHSP